MKLFGLFNFFVSCNSWSSNATANNNIYGNGRARQQLILIAMKYYILILDFRRATTWSEGKGLFRRKRNDAGNREKKIEGEEHEKVDRNRRRRA
jgi:hypothetical protein